MTQIRILGGAMARVPAGATAFAHRDAGVMVVLMTQFEDPAEAPIHQAFIQAYYEALAPASIGVYSNFLEAEGEARIHEAYPDLTYRRLAQVKRQLRPREPVPPQPEHPTRVGVLTARLPTPATLRRRRTPSGGAGASACRARSGAGQGSCDRITTPYGPTDTSALWARPSIGRASVSVSNASWSPKSGA